MPLVHANLYIGMYYSRLFLFPPEYQSSIPQIRKKIFCSFYALSLRKRNIDERKVMQFNGNNDQNRMKFSSAEFAKRFLADKCCASKQFSECKFCMVFR